MNIVFKTLKLENFKNHRDLTVEFGDITKITGENYKGKSSIAEAITWILYGTSIFNIKLDKELSPKPTTYESDQTRVSLLLNADGKDILLGRKLKNGKVSYYINEAPKKATEFNEVVSYCFDVKELFFSLFNPLFFFTQHWEKQRTMLLKYVSEPISTDVLKHMKTEQSKCLKPLLMKNSLVDVEEMYKEKKKDLDTKLIQAETRIKLLQEQLDQRANATVPIESIKAELSQIDRQVREKEAELDEIFDKNKAFNDTQAELHSLLDSIENSVQGWEVLKTEEIADSCKTCSRPFDEESLSAAKENHEQRMKDYKAKHKVLTNRRNELKAKLAELDFIDPAELRAEIKKLDESGQPLREAIRIHASCKKAAEQIEQAQNDEQEAHKQFKEAVFVLDCIKAFRAQEAELQCKQVQALFTTLSVRLYAQNKGDGEKKPDFEIQMGSNSYRALSLSESVRAGLELREVLSNQSSLVMPIFIDNTESITKFKQPTGQLILSRVVAGQELKVEVQ